MYLGLHDDAFRIEHDKIHHIIYIYEIRVYHRTAMMFETRLFFRLEMVGGDTVHGWQAHHNGLILDHLPGVCGSVSNCY